MSLVLRRLFVGHSHWNFHPMAPASSQLDPSETCLIKIHCILESFQSNCERLRLPRRNGKSERINRDLHISRIKDHRSVGFKRTDIGYHPWNRQGACQNADSDAREVKIRRLVDPRRAGCSRGCLNRRRTK